MKIKEIYRILEEEGCCHYKVANGLVYFHHEKVYVTPVKAATMAIKVDEFSREKLREHLDANKELYKPMREALECQS